MTVDRLDTHGAVERLGLGREVTTLAPSYSAFNVAERLLLTGHSHQAWPDVARDGIERAFQDAAEHVDAKWDKAFQVAERVRAGWRVWLDDPEGRYSLAANTHDVLVRWLSALPLDRRPVIVATNGEFHSMTRQLRRLAEAGVQVEWIDAAPAATVGDRLAAAVDGRVAAVMTSTVFFQTGEIAGDLSAVAAACRHHGAELMLDTYHQLGVVPFSLRDRGLTDAFVVGGGYKYLQLGEGNCFLRWPESCELRPIATGWFADFGGLAAQDTSALGYSDDRFGGATYDPISHYRAAAVMDFFDEHELSAELLREVSQHQVGRLLAGFDALGVDPAVVDVDRTLPLSRRAGFLALRSSRAGKLCQALKARGVLTDSRGDTLRFGPAPYLADRQLDRAMAILGDVVAGTLA